MNTATLSQIEEMVQEFLVNEIELSDQIGLDTRLDEYDDYDSVNIPELAIYLEKQLQITIRGGITRAKWSTVRGIAVDVHARLLKTLDKA